MQDFLYHLPSTVWAPTYQWFLGPSCRSLRNNNSPKILHTHTHSHSKDSGTPRISKISKDGMWYVYNMPRSTRAFLFRPWECNDFKFTNIMQGKNQQKTWTLRNQVIFGRFVSSKKCYISTSRDGWNFTRVKPMCVRPFIGDPMNG